MRCCYISIEKNPEVFEFFKTLWEEHGVYGIRVDNMIEGIERTVEIEKSRNDELYFIDIVADDINYIPQLKILSDETDAPILIVTSTPDDNELQAALTNGADFYGKYCESPEGSIDNVIAIVNSIQRRVRRQKTPSQVIIYNDFLISPTYHKVFINETEIRVSKSEMDILQYLISNPGRVLTYEQIQRHILHDEYDQLFYDNLYSIMKRLRSKLRQAAGQQEYIETIRDVGYRLLSD